MTERHVEISETPADTALRCVDCGYDLSGTAVGGQCPECGLPVTKSVAMSASLIDPDDVPPGYHVSKKSMLCPNPNCGYCGKAISKPRGSTLALLILLLLWIVPGLIYYIFAYGYKYACPQCRLEVNLA